MATSSRTRRKTPATTAETAADQPVQAAAPAPRKRAPKAAPAAPVAAVAAPTPAETAAPKPRAPARRKAAAAVPASDAGTAPPVVTATEAPSAEPAAAPAPTPAARKPGRATPKAAAGRTPARKKAPAPAGKTAAAKRGRAAPKPATPETAAVPDPAPAPAPETELAVAATQADTAAVEADAGADTTTALDSDAGSQAVTATAVDPDASASPTDETTPTAALADDRPARTGRRNRRRRPARATDPQAQATAEAVLAVLAAPSGAAPSTAAAAEAAEVADAAPALPSTSPPADPGAAAQDPSADNGADNGADASATATPDVAPPAARPPRGDRGDRGDRGERPRRQRAADAPAPQAEAAAPDLPAAPPTGPAHSRIACIPGDQVQIAWQPGHACPPALRQAAQRRCDGDGHLPPEDDGALPQLLRLAQEGGHTLQVDPAVWPLLAAHRDARHRLSALEAAYPDGPASPALQRLLRVPLPLFQAEGALFAVIAGRALIADDRGLGKGVQAIAAARLWQRHFGVQRVLVLCAPAQRAAWQRAWQRLAGGDDTQVIDGGHHQRPAQWAASAGVRILAPAALQTDAAHLAHWAPDLVIVDEPQQLGLQAADWAALQDVPQALVLSGAPLADLPELADTLVAWLDSARLGPLAALRELQAASRGERTLDDADVERLSAALSRLMLQRQREDVADQLPPVVHSERLLPLSPGQRAAHDRHAALARRLLAGWQASGWCSDADQWRLAQALHGMQQACHRAEPADPASALAEATVQALAGTLAELAQLGGPDGAPRTVVLCASAADQAQLAPRLAAFTAGDAPVLLVAPGEPLPGGIDVVLQAGVPWRVRRQPIGPRGEVPAGQQWIYLVAQDGIDGGLFDTLAARQEAPRGPADGGGRGYLQGEALQQWLQLLQAALAATPTAAD